MLVFFNLYACCSESFLYLWQNIFLRQHIMIEGPITFDRAMRGGIIIALVVIVCLILDYLSAVLLPFFIAWIFAYLLYPLVRFIEHRMKIRWRAVSILIAFFTVMLVLGGVIYLIIPPMVEEFSRFTTLVTQYLHNATHIKNFPETVQWWVEHNKDDLTNFLKSENFATTMKDTMPKLFSALSEGVTILLSIIASCITLLYMFFILMDYEYLTENWIRIFPKRLRPFWQDLASDLKVSLNNYIRGQGLVAFTMGALLHRIPDYRLPNGHRSGHTDRHTRYGALPAHHCPHTYCLSGCDEGIRDWSELLDSLWQCRNSVLCSTDYYRWNRHS